MHKKGISNFERDIFSTIKLDALNVGFKHQKAKHENAKIDIRSDFVRC